MKRLLTIFVALVVLSGCSASSETMYETEGEKLEVYAVETFNAILNNMEYGDFHNAEEYMELYRTGIDTDSLSGIDSDFYSDSLDGLKTYELLLKHEKDGDEQSWNQLIDSPRDEIEFDGEPAGEFFIEVVDDYYSGDLYDEDGPRPLDEIKED